MRRGVREKGQGHKYVVVERERTLGVGTWHSAQMMYECAPGTVPFFPTETPVRVTIKKQT